VGLDTSELSINVPSNATWYERVAGGFVPCGHRDDVLAGDVFFASNSRLFHAAPCEPSSTPVIPAQAGIGPSAAFSGFPPARE
jgi:hypothetical protein